MLGWPVSRRICGRKASLLRGGGGSGRGSFCWVRGATVIAAGVKNEHGWWSAYVGPYPDPDWMGGLGASVGR